MFDFLTKKLSSVFSRFGSSKTLTADAINTVCTQVKDALLEADVPYDVVMSFDKELRTKVEGQKKEHGLSASEQLSKLVRDTMYHFMGQKGEPLQLTYPATIMVMGLQGSGKTTSIAKLARYITKDAQKHGKKRSILVGSVDFYRPAAVDQLEQLAKQASVAFYRATQKDPVRAAQEIVQYARGNGFDVLLLDTAGRLHVDTSMLDELAALYKTVQPTKTVLVLDAMTGQESLHVAQSFNNVVPFNAAILTKMDSDTRGGAAFAFRYVLKKPIAFVGIGEKTDDLSVFYPERAVGRMLGEGDLHTLAEQADEKIKKSDQESAYKAFESGNFTLHDFAQHMDMMNKLGSLTTIMKYMPGMGGQTLPSDVVEKGEREMKRFRAIINSMTPKERTAPGILNPSRKKRIAAGAGVTEADIVLLLSRFKQMQQYAKLIKGSSLLKGIFRS